MAVREPTLDYQLQEPTLVEANEIVYNSKLNLNKSKFK